MWWGGVLQCWISAPGFTPFLLKRDTKHFRKQKHTLQISPGQQNHWEPDGTHSEEGLIHVILSVLTCLLLSEGDIGVHQAAGDAGGENEDDAICSQQNNVQHWHFNLPDDILPDV